jgi:hypothetical protein
MKGQSETRDMCYIAVFVVNMEVSIYALIPLCKMPYNCIKLELKKSLQV